MEVFFFGRWTFIPLFFFCLVRVFFCFESLNCCDRLGSFKKTPFRIKSNAKPYLPNATRSKRWILQKRRSNVVWYTVWIYCTNILAFMLVILRHPLLGCLCWKLWAFGSAHSSRDLATFHRSGLLLQLLFFVSGSRLPCCVTPSSIASTHCQVAQTFHFIDKLNRNLLTLFVRVSDWWLLDAFA